MKESTAMDNAARRREHLARMFPLEGLDVLLVSSPVNVTFLTGFSGESSHLLLSLGRAILISDFRFIEQIAEECPGLETHIRPTSQPLPLAVAEVLGKLGVRSVGFESGHLTVAEYEILREQAPALDWKGGRDRVEQLRAIKDASEVAQIREAVDIGERAFTVFRALLRTADSEKDLHDAMDGYIRRAGGWGTSFPTIIAVGDHAALPHAPPTNRTVGEGELVLVDWGAKGRFYQCDLTRVLPVRTISPKLEEVYTVVLKAQQQAMRRIRPGVKAGDVDAEARTVINQAGFGDFFGHGLGHGLGLQVHEAPFLRPNSETILQAGMVMPVEPGIYLPGWGGVRIEDDVLVTPDGCEVLTRAAKDLANLTMNEAR
jgi:Xaa-Pro aminopeptidase